MGSDRRSPAQDGRPVVRAHRTTEADPAARGREFGRLYADQVGATLHQYRELWAAFGVTADDVRRIGEGALPAIADFSPGLHRELLGIAAGSGRRGWEVAALNARTELIALGSNRVDECTAITRVPREGESPVGIQTWDWHDSLAHNWFVWSLPRPDGHTIHTLTEYGLLGKIGVTTAGLAVHFNALYHRDDGMPGGVPVHVVARRILDEASTVDEAVAIAETASVGGSSSLTVTARGGVGWDTVAIELFPGGPAVVHRPKDSEYLVHTNHFDDDLPAKGQVWTESSTSRERKAYVVEQLSDFGAGGVSELTAMLTSHHLGDRSLCAHAQPGTPLGERVATLAVALTRPGDGALAVHPGPACTLADTGWFSPDPLPVPAGAKLTPLLTRFAAT